MKMNDKYLDMSNAELKIKLTTMENEFEVAKAQLNKLLDKMNKLDKEYISIKEVLNKRTRGKI